MTRKRYNEISNAAFSILRERGINVQEPITIRPLAAELMQRVGCAQDTAYRHINRQIAHLRGESNNRQWGGARPGAGRPANRD